MSGYLIDTDWAVDALNGQELVVQTLLELAPHGLTVSLITYGELYEGALFSYKPEPALHALRLFLDGKQLVPLTTTIMERFAQLRGQLPRHLRRQIGDMDILIAATALEHDLTLLTRNLKHFQHVPDLKVFRLTEPESS